MNTKKVVKKMVKMTTRSVINVEDKSWPPAPSEDSTAEPSDRHNIMKKKTNKTVELYSRTKKKLNNSYKKVI